VNILNKNFLDISLKQFGSAYPQSPRKCLNFEILAKIEGKEAKFFFENLLRPYKDFIQVKKIQSSHACVPISCVDKSALSKKAVKTESLIFRINNTYLPP
jgi:hypothetical protein